MDLTNKVITLRTAYKLKEYHFQPLRQLNGLRHPFVKPVRYNSNGDVEMILSEAERNDPDSIYFIPEDADIVVTEGTTFNLANKMDYHKWLCIKDSELIVPTRDAKDKDGKLLIDGDKRRYGRAEIWIDVPGEAAEKSITKKKLIATAYNYIFADSVNGRLTKCKLLGKMMRNAPDADVTDYLSQRAEQNPAMIIDLYTSGDTALKLLLIDAKENNVIKKEGGLYLFGDSVLGSNDDAMLTFLKTASNKSILDMIKRETYLDYIQQLESKDTKSQEDTDSPKKGKK